MAVDRGINVLNVLLAASLIGASQAYLKAGCKLETLRACGNDYTPYANGPHLHESGQEFDEGCKRDSVQVPCTLKFVKDCTEGVARAAALVAVKALQENIEAICVVGSEPYKTLANFEAKSRVTSLEIFEDGFVREVVERMASQPSSGAEHKGYSEGSRTP
ncbi:uncharacterized protein LOC119375291 [Rhipicephalus sanguineus]|uniref:uncharacterized protein LOC119375291 n=1 Tax=Rhipicephalus sanguineus TaxID=34632 RepID=UPI001893C8FD|nr:uncharacterized protein LOC119375291 [Rhipicephalus sanguineus]